MTTSRSRRRRRGPGTAQRGRRGPAGLGPRKAESVRWLEKVTAKTAQRRARSPTGRRQAPVVEGSSARRWRKLAMARISLSDVPGGRLEPGALDRRPCETWNGMHARPRPAVGSGAPARAWRAGTQESKHSRRRRRARRGRRRQQAGTRMRSPPRRPRSWSRDGIDVRAGIRAGAARHDVGEGAHGLLDGACPVSREPDWPGDRGALSLQPALAASAAIGAKTCSSDVRMGSALPARSWST